MRLTEVLLKQPLRWHRKNMWLYKGRFKEPKKHRPHFYSRGGISLVDLPSYLAPPPRFPLWKPPVPDDPRFQPAPRLEDHPDYQEEEVYTFNQDTKIIEGLQQAQVLTKTHVIEGLPETVTQHIGRKHVPHQDDIIKQYIMQAHQWDPTKEKIKREKLPETPLIWKFKAEKGIPQSRTSLILLRNVMRLCDYVVGPDVLTQRRVLYDHHLKSFFRRGDDPIYVTCPHERVVCSSSPLPLFSEPEVLDESVVAKLPNLYPLLPTIDLGRSHIYQPDYNVPLYSHTITHTFVNSFGQSGHSAQALMFSFAHCVNMAHKMYGEIDQLSQPITVQFIGCDGVTFTLACYQLNTLDLTSESGVKNIAWIDVCPIMDKQLPKRAMLRNTKYLDYDAQVIEKLKAFAFSGVESQEMKRDVQ